MGTQRMCSFKLRCLLSVFEAARQWINRVKFMDEWYGCLLYAGYWRHDWYVDLYVVLLALQDVFMQPAIIDMRESDDSHEPSVFAENKPKK